MRNLHKCPKCAGQRIWVIERYRVPGESAEGRALPVVVHQDAGKVPGIFQSLRTNPVGQFDLFVCDACGYSELWAEGFRDLVEDPDRGVRLIDMTKGRQGPFR
jgi:predicted nucleic-acid-binding Zn-ribbon protein